MTRLIRAHVAEFGTGGGGLLFTGPTGGAVAQSTYSRIWDKVRKARSAPPSTAHCSPSARTTSVTPASQPGSTVEWRPHRSPSGQDTVEILLRIYAKCLAGQDEIARRRIEPALNADDDTDDDISDGDGEDPV